MQQIARYIIIVFNNLPRIHSFALISLTIFALTVSIWKFHIYHSNYIQVIKNIEIKKIEINSLSSNNNESFPKEEKIKENILHDILDNKILNKVNIYKYMITVGDTLSSILNRYGISMNEIIRLATSDKKLCNLKIGQQLTWKLTSDGNLHNLTWKISSREIRIYNRAVHGFKISSEIKQGKYVNSILKGTVGGNFISSIRDIGLTNNEISSVIKVIQWQVDLNKLKKNDGFAVLISYEKDSNSRVKHSYLVGVHLRSEGKDYYAIRAKDNKFYDRNGSSPSKEFLRLPTSKQFRISSDFNPNRLNPITGFITPHLGVDFAMPEGTPILAVGDGEVVTAKHSNAAGYYVAVNHGQTYITRYMHLCKLLVKPSQKVKCGEKIALSGNTGRSTGPHLHYEVWINQQAVNPMTVKLSRIKELTGRDRIKYLIKVEKVISQLDLG